MTKQSPTVQKPAKKTTRNSKTSQKGVYISKTRLFFVSVGVFVLAVSSAIVLSMFASQAIVKQQNNARLDQIESIYSSLKMDEEYQLTGYDVFGDKRVYEWDSGRTYSSVKNFVRGASVSDTVADLDSKIKAAGFTFFDEPYPGMREKQYHYKSEKGEYIRLSVGSKPYIDAIRNASIMNQDLPGDAYSMDADLGPADITIKVNLDDNNE